MNRRSFIKAVVGSVFFCRLAPAGEQEELTWKIGGYEAHPINPDTWGKITQCSTPHAGASLREGCCCDRCAPKSYEHLYAEYGRPLRICGTDKEQQQWLKDFRNWKAANPKRTKAFFEALNKHINGQEAKWRKKKK